MSHLLLKWLNDECRLSRTVYDISDDFKNGFLFGELLDRFGQQPTFKKRFRDANTVKSKLVNFCELERSLRKLDIEMNSDIAMNIMNGVKDESIALVYQIKTTVEQAMASPSVRPKRKKTTKLCISSQRSRKEVNDRVRAETFEKSLRRLIPSDNEVMLEEHMTKKFQSTRREIVDRAQKMQETELLQTQQRLESLHLASIRRVEKTRAKAKAQCSDGTWEKNMARMKQREAQLSKTARLQRDQAMKISQTLKQKEEQETQEAIETFESTRNLPSRDLEVQQQHQEGPETNLDFLSRIEREVTSKINPENNKKLSAQVRKRKKTAMAAQRKRSWRRSQFMTRLSSRRREHGNRFRINLACELFTRNAKKEVEVKDRERQVRCYAEAVEENRKEQNKMIQKQTDIEESFRQDLSRWDSSSREQDIDLEISCANVQLEQCDTREKARIRSENEVFCKSLIDRVVSLTFEMARFRTLRYGHAHERDWVDTRIKPKALKSHRKFQFDVLFASNGTWTSDLSDEIVRRRVQEYENISETFESKAGKCFEENVKLGDLVAHVCKVTTTSKTPKVPEKQRPFRVVLCGSPFQGKSELSKTIASTHDLEILNATDLIRAVFDNSKEEKEETIVREHLLCGRQVPDSDVVALIAKHVNSLESKGRGWILDGYPETASQAQLLETAIRGEIVKVKESRLWKQSSDLREEKTVESVFDAVLRLDSKTSTVFYRALSQSERSTDNIATNVLFDSMEQDNLCLWFGNAVSKVQNEEDNDNLLKQVTEIVSKAKQNYDEAEKRRLDALRAEAEASELSRRRFESFADIVGTYVYEPTQDELESNPDALPKTWKLRLNGTAESSSGDIQTFEMIRKDSDTIELQSSEKILVLKKNSEDNSVFGLAERIRKEEEKEEDEEEKDNEEDDQEQEDDFIFARASKQDPLPNLDNWYLKSNVSKYRIRKDCASYLKSQSTEAEDSYLRGLKDVYKNLFEDEIAFVSRMYDVREDFVSSLEISTETKQKLVTSFQTDFNELPFDMRSDKNTKIELHLRITRLCNSLREMSEKSSEDAKERLCSIRSDKWLSTALSLLASRVASGVDLESQRYEKMLVFTNDFEKIVKGESVDTTTKEEAKDDEKKEESLLVSFLNKIKNVTSPDTSGKKPSRKSKQKSKEVEEEEKKTSEKDAMLESLGTFVNEVYSSSPLNSEDNEVCPTQDDLDSVLSKLCEEKKDEKAMSTRHRVHFLLLLNKWYRLGSSRAACLEELVVDTFDAMQRYIQDRLQNEIESIEKLERFCRNKVESEQTLDFKMIVCDFEIVTSDECVVSKESEDDKIPLVEIKIFELDRLAAALREVARGHDVIARSQAKECLHRVGMTTCEDQLTKFEEGVDLIRWRRFVIALAKGTNSSSSSSSSGNCETGNRSCKMDTTTRSCSGSSAPRAKSYLLRNEFDVFVGDDKDLPLSTLTLWNMYRTKHDEIHIKTFVEDLYGDDLHR